MGGDITGPAGSVTTTETDQQARRGDDQGMCGIIAVLRRPSDRPVPTASEVQDPISGALDLLTGLSEIPDEAGLVQVAENLESADRLLGGVPGLNAMDDGGSLVRTLDELLEQVSGHLVRLEGVLEHARSDLELANVAMVRARDAAWSLRNDRLGAHAGVASLSSSSEPPSRAGRAVLLSVHQALTAIDRLEVRGRDSAGLVVTVWDHGLADVDLMGRDGDLLLRSGAVRTLPGGGFSFVVKAAAEIGELGDNTASMRKAIVDDTVLAAVLASPSVSGAVLGHTRWASVGLISEANAHPLDSTRADGVPAPLVLAVQNGDVDNHADLVAAEGLSVAAEITTDTRVVPALCAGHLVAGETEDAAFRRTVAAFEGSVAVAAMIGGSPDHLQLALRGSGQALYIGLAEDAFIVASEPYGVVELTDTYLRMEGGAVSAGVGTLAGNGQIVTLDGSLAGDLSGIDRRSYDGTVLPVEGDELVKAGITTRDIDRGDYPHYLIKEIGEAPASVRSTLRGRLVHVDGSPTVRLGERALGADLRADLAAGQIRRVTVIGQGTAAVAGEAVALSVAAEFSGSDVIIEARTATELSGSGLRHDMSDTLIIAISQSGTTTDTNRTVDLVRARGARVLAIVNRRNSDLTDRADGVFYTSDGRDVEMSVASTKAFYAQVVAGILMAAALADASGLPGADDRSGLLSGLRELPEAMETVLNLQEQIGNVADRHGPPRRHWAVVGTGPNLIAAREIRIKLSELCYKSIAADATEDKKHIDLSAEPLILVCATGMAGSTADDVAKEVAIYRAHKAAPIVVTDADPDLGRFADALDVVTVPRVHPRLAFVLSTMVGHLFGYEAARAIDAQAHPLREAHAAIENVAAAGLSAGSSAVGIHDLMLVLKPLASRFFDELRSGRMNGHLEASTAARLAAQFRYATGDLPLESYQLEFGTVGTPALVLDDLAGTLTQAIEELTRPIDAIKHQAKTVTVGISRTDEMLLTADLVREVLDAGAPRDSLSYRTLRLLADLDAAVTEVAGFTRYRVDGLDGSTPTVSIIDRGGISTGIESRSDNDPALRGTKHSVAVERETLVTRGARDNRTIILVPEVKDRQTVGLTLLHVVLHEHLSAEALRGVLHGYRNRYDAIRDAVCETEPHLSDDRLAELPVGDLLINPVGAIAERLRSEGSS